MTEMFDWRKFWKRFRGCFPKSRINENGGNIFFFFSFQKASKGNKLQKLHHAALSGNEDEVQKLLGKGVGKHKL